MRPRARCWRTSCRAEQPCDGPLGYHSHALDFQMVYLIRGWARLYFEDIGEIRVEAGDAWYQPPGIKHEVLEYSDDWKVLGDHHAG